MKKKMIKFLKITFLILLVVSTLGYLGHHFGMYNLKELFKFVNIEEMYFGLGTFGTAVGIIVFKVVATFIIDTLRHKEDNDNYNAQCKLDSDKELALQYAKVIEQNEMIIINQEKQMEYQVNKDKVIANMKVIPNDFKSLLMNIKEEATDKGIEIVEDTANSVLETTGNIVEILVDKGLDKLEQIIEKV